MYIYIYIISTVLLHDQVNKVSSIHTVMRTYFSSTEFKNTKFTSKML